MAMNMFEKRIFAYINQAGWSRSRDKCKLEIVHVSMDGSGVGSFGYFSVGSCVLVQTFLSAGFIISGLSSTVLNVHGVNHPVNNCIQIKLSNCKLYME